MIKVKNEAAADNEIFNNSHSTNAIKEIPNEMELDINLIRQDIKQEPELIIKSEFEWSPTNLEDEQQEYYLEYQCNKVEHDDEYKPSTTQSVGNENEEFSITYINENEEAENNENDEDEDGDYDNSSNYDDYTEDSTSDEDSDSENYSEDTCGPRKKKNNKKSENSATTGTFSQRKFLNWLCAKHICYLCPICDKVFNCQAPVFLHMNQQHKQLIDDDKSLNYYTNQTSQSICKQCNKHLHQNHSLLVHSLRHSTPKDILKLFKCNICQDKSSDLNSIQKHIIEKHPDTKETFEIMYMKSKKETYKCPLCSEIYNEFNHMRFHFIDKHPNEYGELFSYPCHLCENTERNYNNDKEFFKHLLEEHNLKNWKLMNFDVYPKKSGDPHFICTKCFKIFTEMDLIEFLRHYLEHSNSYRFCRSCNKKLSLKLINFYHMCRGWFKKFETHTAKTKKEQTALSSWQEFEEYITHTCPFCNEEFETLRNWQIHLRKIHQLDTLKGLEMEKIPNDSDRLKCNICKTFVVNSSVQLHTHRFQHLPYKPYKCRHCSRTFDNYKTALKHVLNKCQDQNKLNSAETVRESCEIVCPACNNLSFSNKKAVFEHFNDTHNNFLDYYTKKLDNNSYHCNVCQLQIVNDEHQCRVHMLLHFARKTYKCLKCSQSFACKDGCFNHIRYHLAKPLNTHREKSNNKFVIHSNGPENAQNTSERVTTFKEFAEFINYACPECNECLATKQLWQEHINEKHTFFQEHNLSMKDPSDGSLKCSHCQLKLVNWTTAQRQYHKLRHMPYKGFICKLCNYHFTSLGSLYSHLRSIHFVKGSHKCPICPVILATPYEKTEHLKNTHPRCEWPDEEELINCKHKKKQTTLKRSVILKDFVEFISFACPECNESFAILKLWQEHIDEKHTFFQEHNLSMKDPSDGSLKCSHCQLKLVSSIGERQKHKLVHMPHKAFICKLCSNRLTTLGSLYGHLRKVHFAKGSHKCPICPVILTTPHEKTEHLKNTHPSEWPDTEEQQLNDSKGGLQQDFVEFINYACPECNESLATQQLWQEHINVEHDFFQDHNLSVKDPSDGSLKCPNCQIKVSSSTSERRKHMLTHMPYKGFLCKLCDYRGTNSGLMIAHLKVTHFVKGSYKCPICHVVLTTPHEKKEHLVNTHPRSEWPELMCGECCTTFATSYTLNIHMRKHDKSRDNDNTIIENSCMKKEKSTKRNLRSMSSNTSKKIKQETA